MTGIGILSLDSDNPAIPLKAQVEAGNVTTDVADIEYADAVRLCDEGLLERIDPARLPAARAPERPSCVPTCPRSSSGWSAP